MPLHAPQCHVFLFLVFEKDDGQEETAIGAFWVTDGIDRCLVGFLPRYCLSHKGDFSGKLAQVVEFLGNSESPTQRRRSHQNHGVCRLAIINTVETKK